MSDDDVRVSGSNRLTDVDCDEFEASGGTTVDGDLHARRAESSGSLEVAESVNVERFEGSGSVQIGGDLVAGEADASGSLSVDGESTVDHLETSGSATLTTLSGLELDSTGSLTAETVEVDVVSASGVLTAETVGANEFTLEMQGESRIDRLAADEIRVEESSGLLGLDILSGEGHVEAGEITGQQVALEGVTADRVEGEGVRIGPDCDVGTVVADRLEVDDSATVGERRER